MVRKLIIGSVTMAVVAMLFIGYIRLTGSKGITTSKNSGMRDITEQRGIDQASQISGTVIHTAENSRYTVLDSQTRQVRRIFGFESLLNPGSKSENWQVRRPYIFVFEDRFQCRLDAEEGIFQVDATGGTVIPKDAHLTGKVAIRLIPNETERFTETLILMDDLSYSSERSEFYTEGPVQVISAQAKMAGRGMLMRFQPSDGRIDYFSIKDLDYLRLKEVVDSKLLGQTKPAEPAAAAASADAPATAPADVTGGERKSAAASPDAAAQPASTQETLFYHCILRDTVEVHYAKQMIVKGADEINIVNILFSRSKQAASPSPSSDSAAPANPPAEGSSLPIETKPAAASDAVAVPKMKTEIAWADRLKYPRTPADDDDKDVIVTCKGGIIIQVMDNPTAVSTQAASVDVEAIGRPLRILRLDSQAGAEPYTMVQCQSLHYSPSSEILKLFVGQLEKTVRLYMNTQGDCLETTGNVLWDRKGRYALVDGPGRIVVKTSQPALNQSSSKTTSASGPAEVSFGQKMDVFFAEVPDPNNSNQMVLAAVNLAGGMKAMMKGSATVTTQARNARLEFVGANQLTEARLDGDVQFASQSTTSAAEALADNAVLTFASENTLSAADLKGHVAFDSEQGQFTSGDAKIKFAKNAAGQLEPVALTSTTEAVMTSKPVKADQMPARFEAKRIDYDLFKGSAIAEGPIVFSFCTPADANDPGSSLPVTITAEKNAEFFANSDKSIRQVVFNGNVIGDATLDKPGDKSVRRFYGDKLTVDLVNDPNGRTNISHVAVSDGNVRLEAKRYLKESLVSHVKLTCLRFDYEHGVQTVLATGPGKIELNNQAVSIADPNTKSGSLDLRQPCYALVEGFESLKWMIPQQKVIAVGTDKSLSMGYMTLKDGQQDNVIKAQAMRTELQFARDANNKNILSGLTAADGIYFEQVGKHVLAGQNLRYTGTDGWVHIEGTEKQPCFVDGARVPEIEYNLQSGQLKTKLSRTPGAVAIPTK